ncbi:ClC family H(+)/Cl(-) exchange transporter [Streptomyces sp. NBC_00160]|uniref:ClC family H(+)/Cl(-) exchange transporter n=1 Tax=Streptomyces sp. NBC_00160 TaxID=2903628 RepID=UPI0022524963|nr:ClC family H(+)/Cl(-) exchange transporter [Streptomyces sp. NBC_00160]MCX5308027.1 ClC family H(+)/Cl(-) exchange transporter [Streptomyces sp. NBC_00160]
MKETPRGARSGRGRSGRLRAFGIAAVAGCLVGLVGGAFRWCLAHADALRGSVLETAAALGPAGRLIPVALTALGAAVACAIAQRVPHAAGSGIQHVEAVWRQEAEARTAWLVPAKFVGGLIAIGSGLVLGREGPIVHMGAAIGSAAGRRGGLDAEYAEKASDADDARMLHTALGGAGLAVAFSAPLGGLLFVCEEVTGTVRPRLVLLTLVGTVTAVATSRLLVGDGLVLPLAALPAPPLWTLPVFLLSGVTAGALGAAYSALVVRTLEVCDRLTRVPLVARAAVIGAGVGALMAFDPLLTGGGDQLSERLLTGGTLTVGALVLCLAVRCVAGPLSYAAATPGGLFAPLLALGALWGTLTHALAAPLLPAGSAGMGMGTGAAAFAVVGMAGVFTGVVRAPLTGTVLVVEMTGAGALLLPLLIACFAATVTADRLGSEPVYDTLRRRMLERA